MKYDTMYEINKIKSSLKDVLKIHLSLSRPFQ